MSSATDGGLTPPSDLTPGEGVERYLNRRRQELSESSVTTYYYRLKLFVEWCQSNDITSVSEYSGWLFDEYESHRSGKDITVNALHNEMETLRDHVRYLERIEAVDSGLGESIHVPEVPDDEQSREDRLETPRARRLIRAYRADEHAYGNKYHTLLELFWFTGARLGGIRGLDLRDVDFAEGTLSFAHRPRTGTPLKNQSDGERIIGLDDPETIRVLQTYVRVHRKDKHDEYGRQPFLTTKFGRPAPSTFRDWSYYATHPCVAEPCPHGFERASCDFRTYNYASKCPSARAPHHIRSGSITWHRDCGYPKDVLKERVNASEENIEKYYDQQTKRERFHKRRKPYLDLLDLDADDGADSQDGDAR